MSVTVKVKISKTQVGKNLKSSLRKLQKAYSQYGYFSSQGKHHSGLKFPYLAAIHEFGLDQPRRPVFQITAMTKGDLIMGNTKLALKRDFKRIARGMSIKFEDTLDTFATTGMKLTKRNFGKTPPLKSNSQATINLKGRNSPLIDTGELMDNMSYKTSADRKVRK